MFFDPTTLDESGFCQFPVGRLSRAPISHPSASPAVPYPQQKSAVEKKSLCPPYRYIVTLHRSFVTSYYATTRTVRRRFKFRVFFSFILFSQARPSIELLLLSL